MNGKTAETIAFGTFVLVVLSAAGQARAQDAKVPYPGMAPFTQYLMTDRNAEIALARSAAPAAISSDAEVLVLGRHGYETAVKGNNGFVCVVERSWMAGFDFPEFWNPRIRGPVCFNPAAARSILPLTVKRTESRKRSGLELRMASDFAPLFKGDRSPNWSDAPATPTLF